MTEITETTANPEGNALAGEPVPAKKPRRAAHARHVAPSKGRSAKKATPAKKAHAGARVAKSAKKKGSSARQGSKTAKFVDLLKRPGGATSADLVKATGWQAHSVRGFISGVLGKKMGLKVTSTVDNGQRRYSLKG